MPKELESATLMQSEVMLKALVLEMHKLLEVTLQAQV